MKHILWASLLCCLSACQDGRATLREAITAQLAQHPAELNLADLAGPDWDRVCFLGPYSTNQTASQTLGFAWDLDARSDLKMSDSINVLVFAKAKTVTAYTEYPRSSDFSHLTGKCLARQQAHLKKADAKANWQPVP